MADLFSQSVQYGLDVAQDLRTSSRGKIHKHAYHAIRERFALPADYARMAINASVSLARSYYGNRTSPHQKRTSFPKVNGSQGIGLGTNAYKLVQSDTRWVLRVSTGTRGQYVWLPLCAPQKFQDRIASVKGDAKLFKRDGDWYATPSGVPIRTKTPAPAVSDSEPTFIGVDLGVVRIASVATERRVLKYFDGKAIRHKREHFADIRRRYQRANRTDKVKAMRGKESRWMRDVNHTISKRIVELALQHDNPVLVFERLDGIRYRTRGSKRFNRMMSSWAFRQLIDFVSYKAEREGIPIIFVDPHGTSKTCSRCGNNSRHNRREQGDFRCTQCGFEENADGNAARNIAARGCAYVREHGLPDTART